MTVFFDPEIIVGIVCWLVVTVFGLATWICIRIHKKRLQFVRETSQLLDALKQINGEFSFHTFTSNFQYRKLLKSKASYDRANLLDILDEWVSFHEYDIVNTIKMMNENCVLFEEYTRKFELAIQEDASVHHAYRDQYRYFGRYEKKEVQKLRLNPPQNIYVTIHKQYTSPKGRNYYHNEQTYTQMTVNNSLLKCQQAREKQDERQRERAKMTDSLRYDILRRDGFKCCICGATAEDGIKLHVDHIKPVAKGGKTEKSNLRTLCDRCNHGKGAKYTPNDKN